MDLKLKFKQMSEIDKCDYTGYLNIIKLDATIYLCECTINALYFIL